MNTTIAKQQDAVNFNRPSWSRIGAIMRKEWQELLYSPVGYIVIAVYLIITGVFVFFILNFFLIEIVSMNLYFSVTPYILAFSVSALTMRLFSEEHRSGAIEVLGTLPISTFEIVVGKFLALWLFSGLTLAFTFGYPLTISLLGDLDVGATIAGYIGQILLTGAFTAIGLFASSVTKNPIASFFFAFVITFLLLFVDFMMRSMPGQVSLLLRNLSAGYHLQSFNNGIINLRNVMYFFSLIVLGIYASWYKLRNFH